MTKIAITTEIIVLAGSCKNLCTTQIRATAIRTTKSIDSIGISLQHES